MSGLLGTLLEADKVYHFLVVYDSPQTDPTLTVYRNGIEVSTINLVGTDTEFLTSFTVGSFYALRDFIQIIANDASRRTVLSGQVVEAVEEIKTNATIQVTPYVVSQTQRVQGTNLRVFAGETVRQSLTLYQSDGQTPLDLSDTELVLVIQSKSGDEKYVLTSEDEQLDVESSTPSVVSFDYPESLTDRTSDETFLWSLAKSEPPRTVFAYGTLSLTTVARP